MLDASSMRRASAAGEEKEVQEVSGQGSAGLARAACDDAHAFVNVAFLNVQ